MKKSLIKKQTKLHIKAPYEDPQIIVNIVFQGADNDTTQHQANVIKSVMPAALSIVNKYNAPETTTVSSDYKLDSYVNQSVSFVKSKLESKAVNVQVIGNGNTVLEQYPEAGSKVAKNDRVFIKTESNDIVLPNFTGWSRKDVLTFGYQGLILLLMAVTVSSELKVRQRELLFTTVML